MNHDQRINILERAVEIARSRGFDDSELTAYFHRAGTPQSKHFFQAALAASPHSLILRHEFAKAFFGEEKILEEYPLSDGSGEYLKIWMPAWHAHLRKMVLEKDPLMYIAKFV